MKLFPLVLSLTTASALLSVNALHAQGIKPCGTDEIRQQMILENPDLLHQEAQYEIGLQAYLQAMAGQRDDDSTVYVLPLVFHVLYDPTTGTDAHNISDAQIYESVNVMNRDYAKENDIKESDLGVSWVQGWTVMDVMASGFEDALKEGKDLSGVSLRESLENMDAVDTGGIIGDGTVEFTPESHRGSTSAGIYEAKDGKMVEIEDGLTP